MSFQVRTETLESTVVKDMVAIVENKALGERAEISTALGFNCFRWTAKQETVELLYTDPRFHSGAPPTRSGIPVLFPFPNRIRDGRFHWYDRDYELTPNDPAGKNAIHGFACRRPWRVVEMGATLDEAWVTGEFQGSKDATDCKKLWPADYRIRLTYRLTSNRLTLKATVDNPDTKPLPFGLGYHPYYLVIRQPDEKPAQVQVHANSFWELEDNLPTGKVLPVEGSRDLRQPTSYDDLVLDDLLTNLSEDIRNDQGLRLLGTIQRSNNVEVKVYASSGFREAVVFTPPHRGAFAIEPYTCTTDAINLQQQGIDAGLLTLQPGQSWSGTIENVIHFKA